MHTVLDRPNAEQYAESHRIVSNQNKGCITQGGGLGTCRKSSCLADLVTSVRESAGAGANTGHTLTRTLTVKADSVGEEGEELPSVPMHAQRLEKCSCDPACVGSPDIADVLAVVFCSGISCTFPCALQTPLTSVTSRKVAHSHIVVC